MKVCPSVCLTGDVKLEVIPPAPLQPMLGLHLQGWDEWSGHREEEEEGCACALPGGVAWAVSGVRAERGSDRCVTCLSPENRANPEEGTERRLAGRMEGTRHH